MKKDQVEIKFTKDEAIVLFEFLSRFSDKDELKIEHQAEERALWNLTCYFERELVEPFSENYCQILDAARERLKDDIK